MEFRDYLGVLRRRWLSIVLTVLVVSAAGFGITTQLTPQYASISGVFISTTPDSSDEAYQGGLFSQQRVASYADVISGLDLAQGVVDELGLERSAETLSEQIEASVVPTTVLLRITVTDEDPELAQQINATLLTQLQALVVDLESPPGGGNPPLLEATVVDAPRLPTDPVSPVLAVNLAIAAFLGLVLGIAIAVARELLDNTVTDPEDVPALREVSTLGSFAHDNDVRVKPLLSDIDRQAPRAEAYRVFGTNVSFVDVDRPSKVLAVTSSVAGEGKSTTAANLALTLASSGSRVLLLDGDLRRPQVATLTGLEQAVGLTTVLSGRATLEDCVQVHASGLHVLTSGQVPPNPADLLRSQAMQKVFAAMRESYEMVIVDCPPLLPVTDAALIASASDGALLVVRHGKTTRDEVSGALERLRAVDSQALGLVLTMVRRRGDKRGYGYGYGYSASAT